MLKTQVKQQESPAMRFLRKLAAAVVLLASLAFAKSSTGDTVLVLLDPSLKKENFSIFLGDLESACIWCCASEVNS